MVYCGQTANGRTESHWFLGREANLCPGTSRPYVPTVAGSYVAATAREASAAAERAAELKIAKYSSLEDKCIFQPIVVESLDPLNETACQFLKDLGRSISAQSGDERESAFLFQRLSVLITLHAKLRYCNWSCLCVCAIVCLWVGLLPR